VPDLEVDLEGLEALASTLERIRTRLDATRELFDAYEGDLGSGRVAAALDDFERHWSDGRAKIDGNARTLATMATASAAAYRQADEDLRASLEDSTGGGTDA
jgi:membrane-bound lytic murein transglycosylase MltF